MYVVAVTWESFHCCQSACLGDTWRLICSWHYSFCLWTLLVYCLLLLPPPLLLYSLLYLRKFLFNGAGSFFGICNDELFWHLPLLLVIGSLALPIAMMPINPLPTLYYLHSTVYCLHSIAWCKFFDLWKFFEMASYYLSPYWYSTAWCKMVLVLPISLYHCCLTTAAATLNSTELLYYTWWILNCYTTDLWCFWWTVAFEFNSFCCLWCQRNLWQNSEHMPLPMMHLAFKLILS